MAAQRREALEVRGIPPHAYPLSFVFYDTETTGFYDTETTGFYDTETTGIETAFDQILQFAAIRTDDELNELDRFDIRCRLLSHLVPAPGRYDSYVTKYMGDGILAYFGYPRAFENDAERAVNSGLGIVEAVKDLRAV